MPPPKRIQELSQQSTTARRVVAWLHLQLLSVISAKSTWDAASGAPDAAPHNLLEATSVGDRPSAEYHVLGRAMPMLTTLRSPIRQWDGFCIDWWQPAPAPARRQPWLLLTSRGEKMNRLRMFQRWVICLLNKRTTNRREQLFLQKEREN